MRCGKVIFRTTAELSVTARTETRCGVVVLVAERKPRRRDRTRGYNLETLGRATFVARAQASVILVAGVEPSFNRQRLGCLTVHLFILQRALYFMFLRGSSRYHLAERMLTRSKNIEFPYTKCQWVHIRLLIHGSRRACATDRLGLRYERAHRSFANSRCSAQ